MQSPHTGIGKSRKGCGGFGLVYLCSGLSSLGSMGHTTGTSLGQGRPSGKGLRYRPCLEVVHENPEGPGLHKKQNKNRIQHSDLGLRPGGQWQPARSHK